MITVVMNDASEHGVLTQGTRLFDENSTEIKGVTLVELRAEVGEMWKIRLEATVKVVRASDPDAPKPRAVDCETSSFDDILGDIRAVLRQHGVMLSPSGYDALQLWKLRDGEDPIYALGIDDRREPKQ